MESASSSGTQEGYAEVDPGILGTFGITDNQVSDHQLFTA
jgi:hypothetical protein